MPSCRKKSVTLIELIIAITLVSVIILGINSISIFSHYHLISSDRRAKLQNDLSYCLDHITKEASKAIGNEAIFGSTTVVNATNGSLTVFIDANQNAQKDAEPNDYWIQYKLNGNTLNYCSQCPDKACATCSSLQPLSSKITAFTPDPPNFAADGNYIKVRIITGRWDPANPVSQDNPEVTMQTTINLPSVSTH